MGSVQEALIKENVEIFNKNGFDFEFQESGSFSLKMTILLEVPFRTRYFCISRRHSRSEQLPARFDW